MRGCDINHEQKHNYETAEEREEQSLEYNISNY